MSATLALEVGSEHWSGIWIPVFEDNPLSARTVRSAVFMPDEVSLQLFAGHRRVRLKLVLVTGFSAGPGLEIDHVEVFDRAGRPVLRPPFEDGFEEPAGRWRGLGWRRVRDRSRPGSFAWTDSPEGEAPVWSVSTLELLAGLAGQGRVWIQLPTRASNAPPKDGVYVDDLRVYDAGAGGA